MEFCYLSREFCCLLGGLLRWALTVWPHWLGPWLVVWFGLLSCLNFDTVDKVVSLRINIEPCSVYLYISQETQFTRRFSSLVHFICKTFTELFIQRATHASRAWRAKILHLLKKKVFFWWPTGQLCTEESMGSSFFKWKFFWTSKSQC